MTRVAVSKQTVSFRQDISTSEKSGFIHSLAIDVFDFFSSA